MNTKIEKCWYCKINNSNPDVALKVHLHKKNFDFHLGNIQKVGYLSRIIIFITRFNECRLKRKEVKIIKIFKYFRAGIFFLVLTHFLQCFVFSLSDLSYHFSAIMSSLLSFIIFQTIVKKYFDIILDE